MNPSSEPVSVEAAPGLTRVVLQGVIDVRVAGQLRPAALAALEREGDIVFDCRAVEHLDVAAIQILLATVRALDATERRVRIVEPSAVVVDLLQVAGAASLLADDDSVPATAGGA